ncbi:hypothetical protein I7I48_05571 [Histoplasma ohiense]|nr:hypothetical protein I7I48_05571 [Histoplasma ohiense (nom. inval.)]
MDTFVHQCPPSSRSAKRRVNWRRARATERCLSLASTTGGNRGGGANSVLSSTKHPCMRRCGPIACRTTIAVGCIRDYFFPRTTGIEYRWVDA